MSTSRLVRDETPVEFFREQLEKALEHQRVATSAFTEFYLVNLLAGCVAGDPLPPPEPGYDEMPLAVLLARALQASRRAERTRMLRALGDSALFTSGFFADHVQSGMVNLGYYRDLGGQAYLRLARDEGLPWSGSVFSELAARFGQFADVLSEVAESSRLVGDRGILALYERWAQTGSRRAAALLAERGITPMPAGEGLLQ